MSTSNANIINDVSNIDFLGNSPIRLAILVFGYVFSNLTTATFDINGKPTGRRKVQINFAPKNSIIQYIEEQQRIPDSHFPEMGKRLPLIGYDITGMAYDNTRQTGQTLKYFAVGNPNVPDGTYIHSPSPFTFDFLLDIWTKDFQSGLDILNQIVPAFKPEISISVKTQKSARMITDVKLILNSITRNDNYTESYTSTSRLIDWQLGFKMMVDWPEMIDAGSGHQGALIREVLINIEVPPFDDPPSMNLRENKQPK